MSYKKGAAYKSEYGTSFYRWAFARETTVSHFVLGPEGIAISCFFTVASLGFESSNFAAFSESEVDICGRVSFESEAGGIDEPMRMPSAKSPPCLATTTFEEYIFKTR